MAKNSSDIFIEKSIAVKALILDCMLQRNIKTKELAAMMDILPNSLSRTLRPDYNLTLKMICAFEAALNIELININK